MQKADQNRVPSLTCQVSRAFDLNFHLIIKQKRNAFPKHSANVKIRGSYEKEKLSKVFLALTVIIIK